MSEYRTVVIETYENLGEPAAERIRARPIPGQGLDTSMKVECSNGMRTRYPVGSKLKIRAKITNREGGTDFLYTHYSWPYERVNDEQARDFIKALSPKS